MKKILLATLATLTLATPAFAGNKIMQTPETSVVDSRGNPVGTKDSTNVSTATPAAVAEAPEKAAVEPEKKAKVTKKKGKKSKAKNPTAATKEKVKTPSH